MTAFLELSPIRRVVLSTSPGCQWSGVLVKRAGQRRDAIARLQGRRIDLCQSGKVPSPYHEVSEWLSWLSLLRVVAE